MKKSPTFGLCLMFTCIISAANLSRVNAQTSAATEASAYQLVVYPPIDRSVGVIWIPPHVEKFDAEEVEILTLIENFSHFKDLYKFVSDSVEKGATCDGFSLSTSYFDGGITSSAAMAATKETPLSPLEFCNTLAWLIYLQESGMSPLRTDGTENIFHVRMDKGATIALSITWIASSSRWQLTGNDLSRYTEYSKFFSN